jgi:hypothetical protein
MTRYGVLGTDLGYPVTVGDRTYFLFGDTIGNFLTAGRYSPARVGPAGANDSIGYISNSDLSGCRYIAEVDQQIAQGNARPAVSQGGCPSLRFFANAGRASDELLFKPIVISGLTTGESQGAFRVPTSGFFHNSRMYMFYTSRIQDVNGDGTPEALLQSLLARSDQPVANWSDAAPPHLHAALYRVGAQPAAGREQSAAGGRRAGQVHVLRAGADGFGCAVGCRPAAGPARRAARRRQRAVRLRGQLPDHQRQPVPGGGLAQRCRDGHGALALLSRQQPVVGQ